MHDDLEKLQAEARDRLAAAEAVRDALPDSASVKQMAAASVEVYRAQQSLDYLIEAEAEARR